MTIPGFRANVQAIALCAIAGVLYFLAFLDFDLFALTWICFVPVLYAIREATLRQTLMLGTLFGAVTNAGGFYWITHLLEEFGHLHCTLAVACFVLLCIYQGFLLAIALTLVRRAQRDLNIAPVWSLAIALPALELAYPLLFPSTIGNSQFEFTVLTQIIDITGMAGLTVLIGLVNGGIYEIVAARLQSRPVRRLRVLLPAGVFALCIGYGLVRLPMIDATTAKAKTLNVGLVQTNIGARDKASDPEEFILRHRQMSQEIVAAHPQVDLIVWPESAYNHLLRRSTGNVADEVTAGIDRPVIFGALTYDESSDQARSDIYNSVLLASATGAVLSVYDKVELLAFGETLPLSGALPFVDSLLGDGSWFTRGTSLRHLRFADTAFLPMICYEDILPALVRRIWQQDGPADVLVNVTNDSWYGDTHQPLIHLALASFRSIETRRALIRSTNTGISAIVDPAGRITQRTRQWRRETLVADVPLIKNGTSTIFMKFGNLTGWLCLALTLWGWWLCRKTKLPGGSGDRECG